jgi:exopolysaccharide production protein ExoQ
MLLLIQWFGRYGLTSIGALGFLMPWVVVVVRQPNAVLSGFVRNWPLLVLPALALMSTTWSGYPDWTLRAAAQYGATVAVGVLAASCVQPRIVLSALFFAMATCAFLSVLDGTRAPGPGGFVLVGVFGSKNYFSATMSLFMLTALAIAIDRKAVSFVRIFAVFAIASVPPLLAFGKSTGAIVLCAFTVLMTMFLCVAIRLTPLVRAAILVFVAFTIGSLLALGSFFSDYFVDLLSVMGKDVTLTGRTYLWQRAIASISEQPLLGVGYQAFWQPGNWGAEDLWRYAGVASKSGFHFHNLYLHISVDLGLVGLIVVVAIFLIIAGRIIAVTLAGAPTIEQLFAISMFIFMIMRTPIEVDGFFQFEIGTVLLCLIWSYVKSSRQFLFFSEPEHR